MFDGPCVEIDIKCVLGEFPGYSRHVSWTPGKDFPALTEELDERAFLCWREAFRHEGSLGRVRRVDLMCPVITAGVELCFGYFLSSVGEDVVVCRNADVSELLLHPEEL